MSKDDVLKAMYENKELNLILSNEQPTFGIEPNGWMMMKWNKFAFSIGPDGLCTVWFPEQLEREFKIPLQMDDFLSTAIRAFYSNDE